MKAPEIPSNEESRLQALQGYHILDTQPEKDFDDIVQLASQICQTPISLISLVEQQRQWFKSRVGLDYKELPRETSFCGHAILQAGIFVVKDTHTDERFIDNPLVEGDPGIRFYAGIPLINPDGFRLGTLCVIDRVPRELTSEQQFALQVLGQQVVHQLELRRRNFSLMSAIEQSQAQTNRINHLNEMNSKIISVISHDLRSPLNTIRGMINFLEIEEGLPIQIQHLIQKLNEMLDSTDEILTTLVQWGASQLSGNDMIHSTVNLQELIEKVKQEQEYKAQQKNNTIINLVTIEHIRADKDMLWFILRNLVGNANKFTDSGTIKISAEKIDKQIKVSVSDTGHGISQDILSTLFSQRQTSRGTQGEKGIGFGLIMCREFIEKLGGSIEVLSEEGKGSLFSFTIPNQI
ncbi:GAF domain-containing sensor histidine kinase [Xanthocytophaga flava]|uniref:GAF domain-containing sensor histidine kinase n=1 Tax=Xanthocytophaga flava TaxID=3048013 RepID=UPI0028D7855D|nr:GAF domain-containing sensor histidine kinase [Xanthocytophaga flavus]MDJ1472070.1 GAF domain-containing sensor histidine kinase [Xanthocytophaga flavus]